MIQIAKELKQLGLPWEPAVGHYVYDANDAVKPTSPFQDGVYFLLNYDCFMQRVGGVDRFKHIMTWLPTWEDLRQLLPAYGVQDDDVAAHLVRTRAIESGNELLVLYQLLRDRVRTLPLSNQGTAAAFR